MIPYYVIRPSQVRPGRFNIVRDSVIVEAGFHSIAAAMNYGARYLWAKGN